MKFALKCSPGQSIIKKGKRIAIIGAGPAGLGAAGYLICKGYDIEIYDKLPEPGGLTIFGIPAWRLPRDNIRAGIKELIDLGVVFHNKVKVVGDADDHQDGDEFAEKKISLEEVINSFDATLIATGTWKSRELGVPGDKLRGSYLALDFLYRIYAHENGYLPPEAVYKVGNSVAVIGAGLTAVDAALESQMKGASDVEVMYRRTINEAPAGKAEINRLIQKGIKFIELTNPVEVLGKESVEALKLIKMKLGKPDKSGRPAPEPIPGSEYVVPVNNVISATGELPTPPFKDGYAGIKLRHNNSVEVDGKFRTTRKGVFAAGDVATGPSLIGKALATGIKAAGAIEEYLETGNWQ
ncbi:MAG: FAD-dependent oxidoreductase [Thermocladium sp.]|jgi:glutamate synthase (NADPH/NADH) small chain